MALEKQCNALWHARRGGKSLTGLLPWRGAFSLGKMACRIVAGDVSAAIKLFLAVRRQWQPPCPPRHGIA